jgi:CheY-like chemotaxis protein
MKEKHMSNELLGKYASEVFAGLVAPLEGVETSLFTADDHAVLRSGLRLLLTSQNEYEVVGEASSGTKTLSLAEQLQPDLILFDLSMPFLGGLDDLPAL